jgi:hypothetical protein
VRREIEQRDLLAAARRHLHTGGQVLLNGIRQRHLAALDEIREQDAREDLGDRAHLEGGLRAKRLGVEAGRAIGRDAGAPVRVQDADHHTDARRPDAGLQDRGE